MKVEHTRTLVCGLGSIGRRHVRTIMKVKPEHGISIKIGYGYNNEEK